MTFRNSIGNLTPPNYSKWLDSELSARTNEHMLLISIVWAMWINQAIVMIVVLLNFLIAVITQTYESVFGK